MEALSKASGETRSNLSARKPAEVRPHASGRRKETSGLGAALMLAWNLGYIIAIPAAVFGFGGAYLDKAYNTEPFLMLAGFAVAVTLSGFGVARKVRQAMTEG